MRQGLWIVSVLVSLPLFGVQWLSLPSAIAEEKSDLPADLRKMGGSWRVKELYIAGVRATAEIGGKARVVVTGDQMTIKGIQQDIEYKVSINSGKNQIDLEPTKIQAPTSRGIYKLRGTDLTLCVTDEKTRPSKFETHPMTNEVMMVLERIRE